MRTIISAARMKGNKMGKTIQEPTIGTKIRILFDLFKSNPCVPLVIPTSLYSRANLRSTALIRLRDEYGLDIRTHTAHCGNRFGKGRPATYWLVGEETNQGYIDYLAKHLD